MAEKKPLMQLTLAALRKKYPEGEYGNNYSCYHNDFYLQSRGFYHCCGALEIGVFDGFQDGDPEKNQAFLARAIKEFMFSNRVRTVFCSTITAQKEERAALEAIGFAEVTTSINPKTRNRITFWAYSE